MPYANTNDGIKLYFEETGSGDPLIFVHEFAGDYRSWEPQMRYFGKRYRCISYNARGYPPSDVPDDVAMYSQQHACEDILAVLEHLDIDKAHVVGLSMGGFATVHFGLNYPERVLSLVVAGCGYGAEKDKQDQFKAEVEAAASLIDSADGQQFADVYALGPTRVQFQNKNPRGWQEFHAMLAEHSLKGSALTMRGVQKNRPSLFDLEDQLQTLTVPTLVLTGDEDWPCLVPGIFLKRVIPAAALQIIPNSGHTINIEEPDAFNTAVADFIAQVSAGRWPQRDERAGASSILGVK